MERIDSSHLPYDAELAGVAAEPLITKRGVSVVLGVSEGTVDRLVADGRLRAYRIGGHRRFRVDDLEAFIAGEGAEGRSGGRR